MPADRFRYRVTCGWLRDLASEPAPHDPWPCIRWDDRLLADQLRFLDVQAEMDVTYNVVWGLFIDRSWPVPFANIIDAEREARLHTFVAAAHERGLKILHGTGIYSWGFDDIIRAHPEVARGHAHSMCPFSPQAWEWQRRVLDFLMDPRWGLDGISMQSADQGRCSCDQCRARSAAEHHADLLVRCAEYVRAGRPDWTIGQASWGLALDDSADFEHVRRISRVVDYMVEVRERSATAGRRADIARGLACAYGSVGGVFVEPPQHYERLRWFVPCGLRSARALRRLWDDGGRAVEYFYRPFANPVEEVSWRTGAAIPGAPDTSPEEALSRAVAAVYGVSGVAQEQLTAWFARGEDAYFTRSDFIPGNGPLSLEPLIWSENPAVAGPPIYLRDRMTAAQRAGYASDLRQLRADLAMIALPRREQADRTIAAINGTLRDLAALDAP